MKPIILAVWKEFHLKTKQNFAAFNKSSRNRYKYFEFYLISFFKIRSSIISKLEKRFTELYT